MTLAILPSYDKNITYVNLANIIYVPANKVLFLITVLGNGFLTNTNVFLNDANYNTEEGIVR